eukprot:scaffold45210_cov63-Phaeocystis_antarctica.AAC.1
MNALAEASRANTRHRYSIVRCRRVCSSLVLARIEGSIGKAPRATVDNVLGRLASPTTRVEGRTAG